VAKENSDKSPTFKKVYESQREYAARWCREALTCSAVFFAANYYWPQTEKPAAGQKAQPMILKASLIGIALQCAAPPRRAVARLRSSRPARADLPAEAPGHTRCVVCMRAQQQRPSPGEAAGGRLVDEEQSRRNYENGFRLVVRQPDLKPASAAAASRPSGGILSLRGQQVRDEEHPEWKILAEWVAGKATKAGRAY